MNLPAATPANIRRITLANLLANIAIVVTGGAVRLTGSGLGCTEWPTCNEGNLFPTPEMPIHTYIEFINRTFTGILIIVALLTWLMVRKIQPGRRDMTRLSLLVGFGIPFQGVLGGITVLTGLNPYTVMAHFAVSMVLIYWSAQLHYRARDLTSPPAPYASGGLRLVGVGLLSSTALTVLLGTLVTASGPHGGDPEAGRTGLDPGWISQLHADAVFLLIGLSVACLAITKLAGNPDRLRTAVLSLLGIEVAQGVLGYVQFFTDLPIILVGLHMLGAALIVMTATFTTEGLRAVRARTLSR